MTGLLFAAERCTLTSAPRTIHLIERRIERWAVRTYCGRTGRAHQTGDSAWRACHACLEALNDSHNPETT